ncbi:NAD(P)-dependent oxidoreductase [Phytohalomonas tamaricis]|uniref:NAD(P)-dependent oxidoreductase n=1 Tax=Phytohalomonas tamaricis TaxID=2081032 RepID=UPI000D0AF18D|nr:NAD(P)-dependent oxidoreductase [Phytohalomonas tamaricis]
MERIGFAGLGLMGAGMASNILAKGYPLTVIAHRQREAVDRLVQAGATEVKTPRELAERSDVVFLCVTGAPQVEALAEGDDGLLAGAHPGLVIVDCSTSLPETTRRLAAQLANVGAELVDAPLGGTPTQAQAGELQAIIGGDEATIERLRPVLATWTSKVVHVGPTGAGHTMKLLNNFLAMGYGAIFAEALTIGARAGITPQTFDSVIRGSRMDSGYYRTFFQYVLERDRDAHRFTLSNAQKDMDYLNQLAEGVEVDAPVGRAIRDRYQEAVDGGFAEHFVPELSDFIAQRYGIDLSQP